VGGDDIDLFQVWHARQQIQVCRPEAGRVDRSLSDGDDNLTNRASLRSLEQLGSQGVFVDGTGTVAARLVPPERGGQESRLSQQAFGAAV
jgi:hypothetical protein